MAIYIIETDSYSNEFSNEQGIQTLVKHLGWWLKTTKL